MTIWPANYRHWARSEGLLRDVSAAPASVAAASRAMPAAERVAAISTGLSVAAPLAGAVYLIDPTLRSEFQTLPLRAQGGRGSLEWFVDGRSIGTVGRDDTLRWPLTPGTHTITVKDATGQKAGTRVVVK